MNNPDQKYLDIENIIIDSTSPKTEYLLSINQLNNVITLEVNEGRCTNEKLQKEIKNNEQISLF